MPGPTETAIRRAWESLSPATPLCTSDNRTLSVLSPGRPNSDAGPDYTDALIRLDGRLYRGDVEIHCRERDWILHGHHVDTHYNKVVLHVVGRRNGTTAGVITAAHRTIPTLVLPMPELEAAPPRNTSLPRACSLSLESSLRPEVSRSLRKTLQDLGWRRFELRIDALRTRLDELLRDIHWQLHDPGSYYASTPAALSSPEYHWSQAELHIDDAWDQLVYEGIVEGLGYAKNKVAFRTLAQNLPLSLFRRLRIGDQDTMAALLFGAAGLLPSSRGLPDSESRSYVRRLRRDWKNLRRIVRCPVMHEAEWLFFRLRPLNFPTARLAVLSHLLPRLLPPGTMQRIIACFSSPELSIRERLEQLRQYFAISPAGYWLSHLHFRGAGSGPSVALGVDRIDAIIFNTLLPAAMLRARLLDDRALSVGVTSLARIMPAPARNSVTRTIEHDVLRGHVSVDTRLLQHGAIELHKNYCEVRRCGECPLGPSRNAGRTEF
jgi:hypothetical protein